MASVDEFIAGLAAYGAGPTSLGRYVVYKVEVVEGRYAGQLVETGVATDELARWPLVPPHWIYLRNAVVFAATKHTAVRHGRLGWAFASDRRMGQRP